MNAVVLVLLILYLEGSGSNDTGSKRNFQCLSGNDLHTHIVGVLTVDFCSFSILPACLQVVWPKQTDQPHQQPKTTSSSSDYSLLLLLLWRPGPDLDGVDILLYLVEVTYPLFCRLTPRSRSGGRLTWSTQVAGFQSDCSQMTRVSANYPWS